MRATRARSLCVPALGLASLFVYVACASNEESNGGITESQADSGIIVSDGGGPASDAGPDDSASPDAVSDGAVPLRCSDADWCETRYSRGIDNPRIVDLWPLGPTAFALDARTGILEYDGTAWRIAYQTSTILSSVWAASADDVWAGGNYGNLVHGVRVDGTWTWSTERVGAGTYEDGVVSLWGANSMDVYFTTYAKVYHRVPEGAGDYVWGVEYEDTQPIPLYNGGISIRQVTGSGPDDVWVLAMRGLWCATVLHKTQGVYSRVADCNVECSTDLCVANSIPSAANVSYSVGRAGVVTSPGSLVTTTAGAPYESSFLHGFKVPVTGPNEHLVVPAKGAQGEFLWGPSDTDLYNGGYGMVVHNTSAFSDAGAFAISTIALNGVPLIETFKVRGTSASDIWAFGGKYALHRTKP
ncbi:hypothetical protein AKJ09_06509 [Labilithrix luteola]|uniref:Uncharacterized protein n=1 Tax=Labilithrix luteola TaxID=1391654 RepID=A0A0K1Q214_9BACT|nr:hypothetical protein [Labilithrix luteola]AKU99845.1 hypothetical protein AKJ09_06509 [Labilithrix luteola]